MMRGEAFLPRGQLEINMFFIADFWLEWYVLDQNDM